MKARSGLDTITDLSIRQDRIDLKGSLEQTADLAGAIATLPPGLSSVEKYLKQPLIDLHWITTGPI